MKNYFILTISCICICLLAHRSYAQADQFARAKQLVNSNTFEEVQEAGRILNSIEKDYTQSDEFYKTLSNYHWRMLEYQASADYMLKAIAINPSLKDDTTANIALAFAYNSLKDYKNQLKYTKAYARKAVRKTAISQLAWAYRWNQMYDSAIVYIKEAIKLGPNDWYPYYQAGRCYFGKNMPDDAVYYLERSIEVGKSHQSIPFRPFPYSVLGEIQLSLGNPSAALKSFDEAINRYGKEQAEGKASGTENSIRSELFLNRAITREILLDFDGALVDLTSAANFDATNEAVIPATIRIKKKIAEKEKMIAESKKPGCYEGNCGDGTGSYRYSTGDVYKGQFSLGAKQGNGVLQFTTGDVYSGTFVNDKFGDGTYTKADGSTVKFAGGQQVVNQEFAKANLEDAQTAKKARKGGFWRALGDVVAGAAVVSLAVLEVEEQQSKEATARANADAARANADAARSNATAQRSTASTGQATQRTQAQSSTQKNCEYYLEWSYDATREILNISNIVRRVPPNGVVVDLGGNGRMWNADRTLFNREQLSVGQE